MLPLPDGLQADLQVGLDVLPMVDRASAKKTTEELLKDIATEDVAQIIRTHSAFTKPTWSGMPIAVVGGSLVGIREDGVGFVHLFESVFGVRRVIAIWVQSQRLGTERALEGVCVNVPVYAKDFIIVCLLGQISRLTALWRDRDYSPSSDSPSPEVSSGAGDPPVADAASVPVASSYMASAIR